MNSEIIKQFVRQLDGIIAALDQAVVIGGRSTREGEACDRLKDARLNLIEEIESRNLSDSDMTQEPEEEEDNEQ
jgi:hypothetical protein